MRRATLARIVYSATPARQARFRGLATTPRTLAAAQPEQPGGDQQKTSSSEQADSKKKKEAEAEERDTTVAGRSPFQAFADVLKEEIRKSREWQDSIKQLQGETSKVADSEAMKRAKEVYERARLTASIKENPRLQAMASELRKRGVQVNDAVTFALKEMDENPFIKGSREALNKAGQAALKVSAPVRETEAYKAIASEITAALDEAGSNVRYGGYLEKQDRKRRRAERLARAGKGDGMQRTKKRVKVAEDPEAGQNVVLHATATSTTESSPSAVKSFMSRLGESYRESENVFVSGMRVISGPIGRFFSQTEQGKVNEYMRDLDPSFTVENWLRELREYIIPEVVDAIVVGDKGTLRRWTNQAVFSVLETSMQFEKLGLYSDGRILDIRGVDLQAAKITEEEQMKVYVVSFQTQEIFCLRDAKTGEVVQGSPTQIKQGGYVTVFTRDEDTIEDEETGGWKIIDFARRVQ